MMRRRLAAEVARQLLALWRVLGQLLMVPWRLLMMLPALTQVPAAPGQVRQRGQETRQWPRVIAEVPVYSLGLSAAAPSQCGSWS